MKKLVLSLFIWCAVTIVVSAQERTITGSVTSSEDGLPIPGASVRVKEVPTLVVATGPDGKFSLRVPTNGKTLVITYLGFITKELTIGNNRVVNAKLEPDAATNLDEVVITAGGVSIKRRQQGNQATTIKSQELTQAKAFNVASALTGKVAGLQVNAVSSGVNPSVRLVLRGNRSLLGNNQALLVVDNSIVPTAMLGNLNPEDIDNIEVLNGAGAAALYGSEASNGALIVTTKTGKRGVTSITLQQTTAIETVSYLPQLQKKYGSGTSPDDVPTYTPFENQQYGPAFDGSIKPIGKPISDGSIQMVPYSYNKTEGKDNFWETGAASQSDFSLSSGDDLGSYYFSSQYFNQTGTVPGDKYNRFSIRLNGKRQLSKKFSFAFNANYIQNNYDRGNSGTAFQNVLMSPGQIPLTRYSDWKNDKYSTPDGYYNEYFDNPYFTLGNARTLTKNNYLNGNLEFRFSPIQPLSLLLRVNMTNRNAATKSWSDKYTYSDYRLSITSGFANRTGSISDSELVDTQLTPEFQALFNKNLGHNLSLNVVAGTSLRDNWTKNVGASSSVMVVPGLYNVSNTTGNTSGTESISRRRQLGVYADARLGYKNYLFLHVTGRNDWHSVLTKENRSLFYPAADISFIASDALEFLKHSKVIQILKLRGGVSKVGFVNLSPYALTPTFGQQGGYPYAGIPGYGIGGTVVAPSIKPELTKGIEAGFDIEMLKSRVIAGVTVYKTSTTDQVIGVNIPSATGFTTFLTNTGDVQNKGVESTVRLIPIRTQSGLEVSLGANFTWTQNKVVSISSDQSFISIGAGVVAEQGLPFPMLRTTTYNKDPQGRVIVDRTTGMPSATTVSGNVGITEPTHRLGVDLSASYKGFRLATVFEYRTGNVILSNVSTGFDFSGAGIRTTYFNRERFVVPNSSYLDPATNTYVENTNITTRTGGVDFWGNGPTNLGVGTNYTYSAAFWKMRELSLAYQLPKSVLRNIRFVKGASISIQGRNLFQWAPKTNIYTDPEYSNAGSDSNAVGVTTLSQTPPGRFYGMTLSLTL
ncbi:SusC/RagA family TonB-linked outer membrane protein [Pedobacter sp. Hv1]|uniref:SusC/RagA family TonB-linked outer membrane protein n=1 Tax=Pedobacter sp. Hv1 TaxID=1740090 RepID=UPI0006D89D2D|nr:SusC/RagA family TonB-linked outer membrane protein [Pedobacter sp. Hv1]KQC01161.1 SusC/RagA family TonB-linked outer membrane protein [Pedobacter sp. Hv1]